MRTCFSGAFGLAAGGLGWLDGLCFRVRANLSASPPRCDVGFVLECLAGLPTSEMKPLKHSARKFISHVPTKYLSLHLPPASPACTSTSRLLNLVGIVVSSVKLVNALGQLPLILCRSTKPRPRTAGPEWDRDRLAEVTCR
jgi:hypothetical protein